MDAALTSSTSLISFRLEEVSKGLTTGRGKSFWYMLEPLIISKSVYDSLTPAQQKAVTDVGQELESFATASAKADDEAVAAVYRRRLGAGSPRACRHPGAGRPALATGGCHAPLCE